MGGKVVFGTHLRGGQAASSLKSRFEFLSGIARRSGLTDWNVLFLELPKNKNTIKKRQKDRDKWEKEAIRLGERLTLIYDLEHFSSGPATFGWNKLQRYAFEDLQASIFVYIDPNPPKWDKCARDALVGGLLELVKCTMNSDYVIGDYTPVIPKNEQDSVHKQKNADYKIIIEEGVKQMLRDRFPSLFDGWILFRELKRPRSEFHALSSRLYDELKMVPPILYDYGLQMLIMARVKGLKVCRVDIGEVPELDTYSPSKMVHQLRRVDFQLGQIQNWWAGFQGKKEKVYQLPNLGFILAQVFAAQNGLASLFKLMRADYYDNEREECVIWLAGKAGDKEPVLKIDHRFFLESDDIGIGFSIHPEDAIKAAVPFYHPHQAEVIIAVDGEMVIESFGGQGEVAVKNLSKGASVTLSPGECHRVVRDPEKEKAYVFVKTNLGLEPDKMGCGGCTIADVENCPLRRRWIDQKKTLRRMGYKTKGHQPKRVQ